MNPKISGRALFKSLLSGRLVRPQRGNLVKEQVSHKLKEIPQHVCPEYFFLT